MNLSEIRNIDNFLMETLYAYGYCYDQIFAFMLSDHPHYLKRQTERKIFVFWGFFSFRYIPWPPKCQDLGDFYSICPSLFHRNAAIRCRINFGKLFRDVELSRKLPIASWYLKELDFPCKSTSLLKPHKCSISQPMVLSAKFVGIRKKFYSN